LGYIIWRRYKKKRFFDFLQLKYFYFASGIISILIIGFSFQNNFADIIEQLFDKSVTFTGRTNIWELALSKVPESPWIGHGMESLHVIVGDAYFDAPHAHNYFLQQLFSVGIIGLIIATMIWLTASKNCHRYFNSESAKALMLAAAALIFTGITESLTEAPLLYPLLCLIHNMEFFVEPVKKGELSKVSAG
jgi:O-antigen ligase